MKPRNLLAPIVFGMFLFAIWEGACRLFHIQEFLLPPPTSVFLSIIRDFEILLVNTGVTLYEAFLGFAIANVIAMLLAVSMVYIRNIDKAIMPFAIGLKTTPIIAMAPLLLLWFGNGLAPKVAAAALICFFPALVNSIKGFNALEEGEEDLFRVYGASKTQMLFRLRFQRAAPYIFAALRVSSSLAIVGAIVGEFVGANVGIGYIVLVSSYHLETVKMFAAITLSAVAGVMFYSLVSYFDRKYVFWMVGPAESIRLESPPRKMERSAKT